MCMWDIYGHIHYTCSLDILSHIRWGYVMTFGLVVLTSCFILKPGPRASCLAPFSSSSVCFSLPPSDFPLLPSPVLLRLTPPVPRPLVGVPVYVVSVPPHVLPCSVYSVFVPWSPVSLPCLTQLCLLVSCPGMFLVFVFCIYFCLTQSSDKICMVTLMVFPSGWLKNNFVVCHIVSYHIWGIFLIISLFM